MLDSQLHVPQFFDGGEIQIAPVDERLDLFEKARAEILFARSGSGLDQSGPLPALPPRLVVEQGGSGGLNQRAAAPHGPKPKVGAEDKAFLCHLSHRASDSLRQTGEEFPWRFSSFATALTLSLFLLVEVDQVDIGAEIELLASQFPHAKDDEAVFAAAMWELERAVILFQFPAAEAVGRLEHGVGKRGDLPHRLLHGNARHKVPRPDAEILAPFVPAQRPDKIFGGSRLF